MKNGIAKLDPTQQKWALRPKGQTTQTHTSQIKKKKETKAPHTTHSKIHTSAQTEAFWNELRYGGATARPLFCPCFVLFVFWGLFVTQKVLTVCSFNISEFISLVFRTSMKSYSRKHPPLSSSNFNCWIETAVLFFLKIDIGTNEILSVAHSNNQSVERVSSSFWYVCCCTWLHALVRVVLATKPKTPFPTEPSHSSQRQVGCGPPAVLETHDFEMTPLCAFDVSIVVITDLEA